MNELLGLASIVAIVLSFLVASFIAYIIFRTKIEIKPRTALWWCIKFFAVGYSLAEIRNFVFGYYGWSITEYVMGLIGL